MEEFLYNYIFYYLKNLIKVPFFLSEPWKPFSHLSQSYKPHYKILALWWKTSLIVKDWLSLHHRCSIKKVFLDISQNSQENTCARVSFLMKLRPATLLKKWLWHRCFPVDCVKILRTLFSQNTSGRPLLDFMLSKDQSLSNRDTAETSATRNPSWIFWKDHLVKMCFLTNLTNSFTLWNNHPPWKSQISLL